MQDWKFELVGTSSLLMHRDDVLLADAVQKHRHGAGKKGATGDDRFPPWTWKTYLYSDGERVVLPAANLSAMLVAGGKKMSSGRRGSLKMQAAVCCAWDAMTYPILGTKGVIPIDACERIAEREAFDEMPPLVRELGFDLDVVRAKISTSKHVRVRPKFLTGWRVSGGFTFDDSVMTPEQLGLLWETCGAFVGLCDYRPGANAPGWYGRFEPVLTRIDAKKRRAA